MHKLLERQFRQTQTPLPEPGSPAARMLELVTRTYEEADEHRRMIERSLEVTSDELHGRNLQLQQQLNEVRRQAWVLENMHDAAMLLTLEGRITHAYAATAEVFGRPPEEMAGRLLGEFILKLGEYADFAALVHAVWERGRWASDLVIRRPDGSDCTVETTLVVLVGDLTRESQLLAIVHDVTHRRRVERQLIQSQKLEGIGQLAAGVAHEINTPAQYVSDNLQFLHDAFETLLLSETPPRPEELEFLRHELPAAIQQSESGMQRIAEIVRGIKLFAHPGGGERTEVDLAREIESVIVVSRNEWKYVADLTTDVAPDLPRVPSYPGELSQVVLNLIVNAAHAIGEARDAGRLQQGRIHVSSMRVEDWVEVRVEDNGGGIPEGIRTRIFDPFFTTKPVGKGTGQGLAISHSIVEERHGGTLRFETVEGEGTTFIVRVPLEGMDRNAARAA